MLKEMSATRLIAVVLLVSAVGVGGALTADAASRLGSLEDQVGELENTAEADSTSPIEDAPSPTGDPAAAQDGSAPGSSNVEMCSPEEGSAGQVTSDASTTGGQPTAAANSEPITEPVANEDKTLTTAQLGLYLPFSPCSIPIGKDTPSLILLVTNLSDHEILSFSVRLIIVESKAGDGSLAALERAYSFEGKSYDSEDSLGALAPGDSKWVVISFQDAQLPAAGNYQGWIVVDAPETGQIAKQVTITVVSSTYSIDHRLSNSAADAKVITLTADRDLWRLLFRGTGEPGLITLNHYTFRVWEKHLYPDINYKYVLSELANTENGQTSLLTLKSDSTTNPGISDIEFAEERIPGIGEYNGTLSILLPAQGQIDEVDIKLLVRDKLIYPFLVIFLGSLIIGLAIRFLVPGDADKQTNFKLLEALIVDARLAELLKMIEKSEEDKDKKQEMKTRIESARRDLAIARLMILWSSFTQADKLIANVVRDELGGDRKKILARQSDMEWKRTPEQVMKEVNKQMRYLRNGIYLYPVFWALVAAVIGLVYIRQFAPTFGTGFDYAVALAWAFGMSNSAKPVKDVVSSILELFSGKPETGIDPPVEPAPGGTGA